jgi:DNA invertase Pin-like site-specific DNA recombinase
MTAKPKDLQLGWAIYTRLSEDRDGTQTATARQEADARKLAADRDWTVSEVFTDVDLSAFNRRVKRPGFEHLLEALAGGRVAGVITWKLDRLTRQPRDLERLLDALEQGRAGLASVHDPVDVSGPMGLAMLRIGVVMANVESSNISIRGRRKAEELARAGAPTTGGTRAFGYTRDRRGLVDAEARLIREAASRILAGESTRGIARAWNEAGVPTPTGGQWVPGVVARLLRAPLIAGLRSHRGDVVAEGAWPAIIDRDTHERLRVELDPAARRTTRGRPRTYLLTGGIARCAVCSSALVSRPREDGRRRYVCAHGPGLPGCGAIAVMADDLEAVITEAVITRIASPTFADEVAAARDGDERGTLLREHADLERRLEQLAADYYADGGLTRNEYEAARRVIVERIERTGDRLTRLGGAGVIATLPRGEDALRGAWQAASIDWRRQLVAAAINRVTIDRAVRGRNKFDPRRLGVTWRDQRNDQLSDAA